MGEKETSSVLSGPIGRSELAHRVCGFESVNHPLTESGSFAARDSRGYPGAGHEWSYMNGPATWSSMLKRVTAYL